MTSALKFSLSLLIAAAFVATVGFVSYVVKSCGTPPRDHQLPQSKLGVTGVAEQAPHGKPSRDNTFQEQLNSNRLTKPYPPRFPVGGFFGGFSQGRAAGRYVCGREASQAAGV
ncbi:MAG: hypothetical protein ACR2OZ_04895, partial [Verrucomicrobiales bacterium]